MTLLAAGAGELARPRAREALRQADGRLPSRVRSYGCHRDRSAVVLSPSPSDPLRPVVRIIATESGELIGPIDLDLTTAPDISVRGCVDGRLLNIDVDAYL